MERFSEPYRAPAKGSVCVLSSNKHFRDGGEGLNANFKSNLEEPFDIRNIRCPVNVLTARAVRTCSSIHAVALKRII